MKQAIACLTFGALLFSACNQDAVRQTADGLIVAVTSGETKAVKLEVVTDDIIRVMASPTGVFEENVNLIKDTRQLPVPAFEITRSGDTVTLSTATTRARLLRQTGEVWFTDKQGNIILREQNGGGKEFTPVRVDGTNGYSFRQVFENGEDEGLYGLGQHQSDEFNYKGKNEELFQYNTKVSVPFIVSTKGYGVLWHNYSLSRFGDKRPYADLGDVFKLYGKDGEVGALTATYYKDRTSSAQPLVRKEIRFITKTW